MRIYLAQHGLAIAEEVDPARPLSPRGRADVEALARLLGEAGVRVGTVVHSGKARAEQTAAVLARHLLPAGAAAARSGLGPKDPVEPVATVAAKGPGLIASVTARPGVELLRVTRENRDALPEALYRRLQAELGHP